MSRPLVLFLLLPVLGCASEGDRREADYLSLHRERLRRLVASSDAEWDVATEIATGRSNGVVATPAPGGDPATVPGSSLDPRRSDPSRDPSREPSREPAQDPARPDPNPRSTPSAQDPPPRHIDDVLPPRTGQPVPSAMQGGAADQVPTRSARVGAGFGRLDFDAAGSSLDGDSEFVVLRAGIGSLPGTDGGGLALEFFASDDDLFAGRSMDSGNGVRGAAARALGLDVFPHWTVQLGRDRDLDTRDPVVAVPLRIGPFVDAFDLDHRAVDVERRWYGFGGRAELEPTWRLVGGAGTRLELVGLLGADLGVARFTESYLLGSSSDATSRWMGEVGAGVRLHGERMSVELGYRYRRLQWGSIDSPVLDGPSRTHADTQIFYVDFGLRF